MLRLRHIMLAVAMLIGMGATDAWAQPHGATHGVASVNAAGGATYTIPIWCPAGPAGLTPQIALTYSSLSGQGVAGRGWGLAGVSAISRAPRTVLHDGAAQGIDLSPDDAWAWDGQRLLPLPNQSGHYRTEIESHAQITAELNGDGQPSAFSVRTRDGHTLRYAQPHRLNGCWHRPLAFHLTEHLHPDGWRIYYTYTADAGELLLSRISYGPYAIAFGYEQRPDRIEAYIAGYELFTRNRLRSITVTGSDGSTLRTYTLSYAQGHDGGSELKSIAEAGSDGKPLRPTTFAMRPGGSMSHEPLSNGQESWRADLDGDGRDDIVRLTTDGSHPKLMQQCWSVYLSSSGTWRDMGTLDPEQQSPVLADRDGDGRPEVYINRTHQAHVGWDCERYARGCNASKPITELEPELLQPMEGLEPSPSMQPADTLHIELIPQPGLEPDPGPPGEEPIYPGDPIEPGNPIGPGNPTPPLPPVGCCSWKPRYQEQRTSMGYAVRAGQMVCTGELREHVSAQSAASMGAGRVRSSSMSLAQSEHRDVHVADLNADGLDDIIIIHKSSHEDKGQAWSVHLNQGDGTFAQHGSRRSLSGNFRQLHLADINGDGLVDVYLQHNSSEQYCLLHSCGGNPDHPSIQALFVTNDTTLQDIALEAQPWWEAQPWDTMHAIRPGMEPIKPVEPEPPCCMWSSYSVQRMHAHINDGLGNLVRDEERDRTIRAGGDDNVILTDLDGDGRANDYVVVYWDKNSGLYRLISTSMGSLPGDTQQLDHIHLIDYNGDGRTDILLTKDYGSTAYSYLPRRGFVPVYTGYPTEWHYLFPGDFNGDGRTDFLTQCEGQWTMSFAKGGSPEDADAGCFRWPHFENLPFSGLRLNQADERDLLSITVADFNGDGLDDVLQRTIASKDATTATYTLFLSNGRGNFTRADAWTHNYGVTVYKDHKERPKREAGESWLKWLLDGKQIVVDHNAGHAIGRFHSRGQAGVYIYHGAPSARQELRTPTYGEQRGLLRSITDGLGRTTTFAYEHLSAPGMHTRGSGSSWPMVDAALNHLAVRQMDDDDGVLGRCATTYTYSGAMVHAQGRGFLGFREMRAQSRRGTSITRLAPLAARGMAVGAGGEALAPNGTMLSRNMLTYTAVSASDRTKGFALLLTNAVQTDGATGVSTTTSTTYDANSDPIRTQTTTSSLSTTVERSFDAAGRVLSQTTTTTRSGEPPHTQTASFTYDDKGHPLSTTTERGTARYTYDARGLMTAATDVEGRTSRYTYNAYGQVLTATDPLGRSVSYAYGAAGELRSTTDAVGTSAYTYDALGRQTNTSTPFGSSSTAVSAPTSGAPSKAVTTVISTADGQPKRTTHLDAVGRLLRAEEQRDGGRVITSEPTYNALGQVSSDAMPRYANEAARRSHIAYDAYGRISSSTDPYGRRTALTYRGLTTTTTDPSGRTTTQTQSADGLLLSSADAGGTVSIRYSSAGLPLRIKAHGMATTLEYDALGRRTAINDPSAGRTTFAYDGLSDRLARRTDARGQSTAYTYDQHGRLTSESSPDGTFSYTYISAGPAIGQLQRVAGNGAVWTYAYDQRGLLAQEQMGMDGQTLRTAYQYDAQGRMAARTYPSGYAVRYAYSPTDGQLTRIDGSDGQPLWRRGKEDALGRPLTERIGPLERTHTYDAMGHLTALTQGNISRRYAYNTATGSITRREANGPLLGRSVEQFSYDAQDRLSNINGARVLYDQRGNITQMPGVGNMQHAGYQLNVLTAQAGFSLPEIEVDYAANGRPKRMTSTQATFSKSKRYNIAIQLPPIDEPSPKDPRLPILEPKPNPKDPRLPILEPVPPIDDPRPVPTPKDPRNELLSTEGTTITVITTTTDTWKWLALHGPGGIKIRTEEFKTTTVSEREEGSHIPTTVRQTSSSTTTRYHAPSFEREITNGQTTDYSYINSPNGLVAAVKTTGSKHDAMMLATDHLGSIIGVWNASGTLLEEHRYTAWGQRTSSTASPRLRRGFTGHEHLTQFGIIDMQARLYDPHLGRFLAPDPYVQAPEMSMNFNRYTYCFNNPLKYTDPTGEFCITPIIIGTAAIIGAYTGGVIANNGKYNPLKWDSSVKTWGYMLGGAAIGAASSAVGIGIGVAGGGAWWAGAAAGAIGAGGFAGLASSGNPEAILKGIGIGAVSGFLGGCVASAIGGGLGAFAGGATASATSQWMYNDFDVKKINWVSVAVSALSSTAMYHAVQISNYYNSDIKSKMSYRQFSKINTAQQRSRFRRREYGVIFNKNKSARIVKGEKYEVSMNINVKNGDTQTTAHTHWAKDGKIVGYDVDGTPIETVGHHSEQDLQLPGQSFVVGRTTSSYYIQGTSNFEYIQPDPFLRYFLFPYLFDFLRIDE